MSDVTAASVNPADVQTALNQAGPDGRVRIPAGRGLYPANTRLSIPANCRIEGAGIGKTIFEVHDCFIVVPHPKHFSGFTAELFNTNEFINSAQQDMVLSDWEIDNKSLDPHCVAIRIVQQNAQFGHPSGVIKNFLVKNARILGNGAAFGNASQGFGHEYWQDSSRIGQKEGVVVYEDFKFHFDAATAFSCIDSNNGYRMVARKFRLWNTTMEAHDVQGDHRATRSWEIYDGEFDSDGIVNFAAYMRGGTGVMFNVTVGQFYNTLLAFSNQRSWNRDFLNRAPMFACNGQSLWDGNESGQSGWPARDQIGRGRDLGAFPSKQESEPVYVWNCKKRQADGTLKDFNDVAVWNTGGDVKPGGSGADIKVNREWFIAPRPNYTPLAYPHPLVGSVPAPLPEPTPVPLPEPTPPANQAPRVTIKAPADGAVITTKSFTIAVECADDSGVTWLELSINGQVVKAAATQTMTYSWHTSPYRGKGPVAITAMAKDAEGAEVSQGVTVTVKK